LSSGPRDLEEETAGPTDIHLSIHGARAEVHDFHTGRPGSFDEAVIAVSGARSAGVDVAVTTVLTRSNQAVLSELPSLLSRLGVVAWQIAVPIARRRAEDAAPTVLPRLALALPYALHALDRADKAGLSSFIAGAPLCLLGPVVKRALPTPARAYGPACEACPARDSCPGVDTVYLERFGGDELRRRAAPEAASSGRHAQLFAGTGEVVAPRPRRASSRDLVVIR